MKDISKNGMNALIKKMQIKDEIFRSKYSVVFLMKLKITCP